MLSMLVILFRVYFKQLHWVLLVWHHRELTPLHLSVRHVHFQLLIVFFFSFRTLTLTAFTCATLFQTHSVQRSSCHHTILTSTQWKIGFASEEVWFCASYMAVFLWFFKFNFSINKILCCRIYRIYFVELTFMCSSLALPGPSSHFCHTHTHTNTSVYSCFCSTSRPYTQYKKSLLCLVSSQRTNNILHIVSFSVFFRVSPYSCILFIFHLRLSVGSDSLLVCIL